MANAMPIATAAWMNPSTAKTAVARFASAKVASMHLQRVRDHVACDNVVSNSCR
ncbi:secreted protein [Rhodopirellula europaea SH398]|uniref:Secreted protein n=1 Tax=Rhodopirellula europaea SH398 TaxID=1263868 RepID=M5S927_9BACT|nr:secreted protein [Rhodopirellula europaea SH398]